MHSWFCSIHKPELEAREQGVLTLNGTLTSSFCPGFWVLLPSKFLFCPTQYHGVSSVLPLASGLTIQQMIGLTHTKSWREICSALGSGSYCPANSCYAPYKITA